ncbi:disease resistance protein L6-like [Syzygium oleosum]|uniref:disease resistance protein L6-like n=1 Tax=Syzygium oleosum TaxID=219896 RepID=UPI0024B87DA4|nr:disease resistance protein L6-like [Syzygium oleosum]
MKKVMEFVDNNSHATLFVVIHGMGGIGKTTLAKTIYNKLSNQFEHCSFIADIRESCKGKGLDYLQNQLISDILNPKNQVSNKDEGIKFISSKFVGKKVLILLDDVDDDDQLKALAGKHNWFSSGSMIIITTRNKSILDNAKVDYQYEHEEMDGDSSLILFSRHAFRRDAPPKEFEDLTRKVVSATGGLPLSLKVVGSFLCDKELVVWTDTLRKLRNVPPKEVQEKLRISYDALDYEQQQIFLDIACFFIGTDLRIASYMWDACELYPKQGIVVLRLRSLIKVGENHELRMHDQLRDFGREIVRQEDKKEPRNRSRLWDSEEVLKILEEEDEGTEKIEAIYLTANRSGGFGGQQFKKLRNLRFLEARGAHFNGDFKDSFKKLKWLQWRNCPLTFEANNFHLKELVVLDMSHSEISDEWQGWSSIMMATKLKYLDLTFCKRLERLPTELGKLGALEELCLDGSGIRQLPNSIGDLQNLEILNIRSTKVKELPNSIGRLTKLRVLDAANCYQLGGELPKSIRNLSSLQCLYLYSCDKLQSLPVLPSSLTHLGVSCQSRKLTSLSNLTHLKVLQLYSCPILEHFWEHPSALNTPFELDILEISSCGRIKTLNVSLFSHLRTLSVKYCDLILEIRGLDNLKCLESLEIVDCPSIERLDLPKSKGLKKLIARDCEKLVEIQGLDRSESLEGIDISWCHSIERLDLSKSKGLKIFNVFDCENLVEIQSLDTLESLAKIDICKCTSITRLDLPKSEGLKIFSAEECKNLVEIQGLDRLESLEEINICWCTSIERLDLSKSEGLKIFNVGCCKNLVDIQGLDRLKSLEEIKIFCCTLIERLDLPKSKGLKIFNAEECKNLVEIQGLDWLESLEEINISQCTSIERLDLSKSEGLKIFYAVECKNLVEIQGLDRLESLEKIDICGCTSITRLDLPKSEGLKIFNARYCENLVDIQGLDRLKSLEKIDISKCTLIQRLDLSKSEGLKIFNAGHCENLVDIQGLDRLKSLEEIDISECILIQRLDLSKSKGLKKLSIEFCENSSLKHIDISGCSSIEILPDLSLCTNLISLVLQNCEKLTELEGLEELEKLMLLDISGCKSLKTIPELASTRICRNYEKEAFDSYHT